MCDHGRMSAGQIRSWVQRATTGGRGGERCGPGDSSGTSPALVRCRMNIQACGTRCSSSTDLRQHSCTSHQHTQRRTISSPRPTAAPTLVPEPTDHTMFSPRPTTAPPCTPRLHHMTRCPSIRSRCMHAIDQKCVLDVSLFLAARDHCDEVSPSSVRTPRRTLHAVVESASATAA